MNSTPIKPDIPSMVEMIAARRASWHGFDRSSCQWMMTAEYQDLASEEVVGRFNEAFKLGKAQIRMKMTGINVEAHDPQPIYAFKLATESPEQTKPHLLILRINAQTGQLWDVKRAPISLREDILGVPQQQLNQAMELMFDAAAHWHKETFGVGPVAPPIENTDPEEATKAMLKWTSERAQTIADRTPDAANTSTGPRL